MTLFRRLINASKSAELLSEYVSDNIQLFYNLHNSSNANLNLEINDIREFIETKRLFLNRLDFSSNTNKSFISILFDLAERFGLLCIVGIEDTLVRNDLYLGERRDAAKLFLLNIRSNDDYIHRFDQISSLLQSSIETEEDSDKDVLVTFINYFAKIVRDTSTEYVEALKQLILSSRKDGVNIFLQSNYITRLIEFNYTNLGSAYEQIHNLIDEIYERNFVTIPTPEVASVLLIETDTSYANQLSHSTFSFDNIRNIAVSNSTWDSKLIHRGVDPLQSEGEMFIYLKSFGKMHKAKINSCLSFFPWNQIENTVEIIDWGCGQGLASVVLNEYLKSLETDIEISKLILIEPSIIGIKRAALHVHFGSITDNIKTICKGFNSLEEGDLLTDNSSIKIHLFSNVLDIGENFYSQKYLIDIIKKTQKGTNYFICASPYLPDFQTLRIENFVNSFRASPTFEMIKSIDNRKGTWIYSWSRVIRIFKVTL